MYMFFDRLKGYFIERHCHRKHKPFYTITGNKNTLTHTPNFSETQKPTHMAKREKEREGGRGRVREREVHQCKLNLLKQYQIEINVYIENGINDVKVKCPFVLPCVV